MLASESWLRRAGFRELALGTWVGDLVQGMGRKAWPGNWVGELADTLSFIDLPKMLSQTKVHTYILRCRASIARIRHKPATMMPSP